MVKPYRFIRSTENTYLVKQDLAILRAIKSKYRAKTDSNDRPLEWVRRSSKLRR